MSGTTAQAATAQTVAAAREALIARMQHITRAANEAARAGLSSGETDRFLRDSGLSADVEQVNAEHLNEDGFRHYTEKFTEQRTALDASVRAAAYALQEQNRQVTDDRVDAFLRAAEIPPGETQQEVTITGRVTATWAEAPTDAEIQDAIRAALVAAGGSNVNVHGTDLRTRRVRV